MHTQLHQEALPDRCGALPFRDNLEADFRAYSSASYTIKDAAYMLQKFIDSKPKHLTVLLVKDNKAHAVAFSIPQLAFTAKRVRLLNSIS